MKNLSSVVIALVVSIVILGSCTKNPEDKIQGTWTIDKIESTADMTPADMELFESSAEEQKEILTYKFDESKMTMKYGDEISEWAWNIDKVNDSLKLNISIEDRNLEFNVKELTENKLIWEENVYDEYIVTTTLVKKPE
ncbi:MAG: hypothetical protein U9N85_02500 [Bacteroidota bacterium]|nr:hypothetical protein [Bacteroidota bacterium]